MIAPRNIITWGDLVPTLRRRYGLRISPDNEAFLNELEHRFVGSLLDRLGADSIAVGQDDFLRWTAPLASSTLPLYVLDDIHLAHVQAVPVPVTRNFSSVPPAEPALRPRSHELEQRPLAGAQIDRPLLLPATPIALLDDGIFSGGTMLRILKLMEHSGVTVDRVYVVVARRESLDKLSALYEDRTTFWVLGPTFETGWDHCRDLLGIHGLKVGGRGFVPYWNIPHWISLEGIDQKYLINTCKEFFEILAVFLSNVYGLVFERQGLHLLPQVRCTIEDPG